MLIANNISKCFGNNQIIENFNFSFKEGIYGLIGKNGSGKSTLLKILSNLDNDYKGELIYQDILPEEINQKRTYLPDFPDIYSFIFGYEFVSMISSIRKIDGDKYINRYSKVFTLDQILNKRFEELSLGQRKKLFATVSLIDEADYWILDEPTNGLDQNSVEEFAGIINSFAKKGTVIISDHRVDFIQRLKNFKEIKI